jgi:hypothetical protein
VAKPSITITAASAPDRRRLIVSLGKCLNILCG